MRVPLEKLSVRGLFTRQKPPAPAPASQPLHTAPAPVAVEPPDDNFYFETVIASPAVQLSVWELVNDAEEPRDGAPDDELDEGILAPGHTAPAEYWMGEPGQRLLMTFDGRASATGLGTWLAETFPNLYGPGGRDFGGKSNAYIAAVVRRLLPMPEPPLEAQVLALALAVYATRTFLGGSAAAARGFRVSPLGVGACICNVGPLGRPFRVASGSTVTVLDLLLALDAQAERGVPLAGQDDLRRQAHDVLNLINRFGAVGG